MFSRSKRLRSGALCAVDDDALMLAVDFSRLGRAESSICDDLKNMQIRRHWRDPVVTETQLFLQSVCVHGLETVFMSRLIRPLRPVHLASWGSHPLSLCIIAARSAIACLPRQHCVACTLCILCMAACDVILHFVWAIQAASNDLAANRFRHALSSQVLVLGSPQCRVSSAAHYRKPR